MDIVQAVSIQTYEYSVDKIEITKIKISVLNVQTGKKYCIYINDTDNIWLKEYSKLFQNEFNKFYEFIDMVFQSKLNSDITNQMINLNLHLKITYSEGFMPITLNIELPEFKQESTDIIIFQLQQCKNDNKSLKSEMDDLRRQLLGMNSLKLRIDELTDALNLFGKSLNIKNNYHFNISTGPSIYYPITDCNGQPITDETFWTQYNNIGNYVNNDVCLHYNYEKGTHCFRINALSSINIHEIYFNLPFLKKIETDVFKYAILMNNIKYNFDKYGRDWGKLIETIGLRAEPGRRGPPPPRNMKDLSHLSEELRDKICCNRRIFNLKGADHPINDCWDLYIIDHIDEVLSWDNFKKLNDIEI